MAKKNDETFNYKAAVRQLKAEGPKRLYLLWGRESYLRDLYYAELKKACLPDGEDDFSFRRLEGPGIDMRELSEAVNALPFMTERTLTEVRGFDMNKCRDEASIGELERILSDLPDYCTLVFIQQTDYDPDWRLKAAKSIKKYGEVINFTSQGQTQLMNWIGMRFSAAGKTIRPDAAMRLIFLSGGLMSGLIPEIDKITAGTDGSDVTVADIDRLAHHIPEAEVFDMTDRLAARDFDGAARLLGELISGGEEPIMILATMGMQMRRLYAARLAIDNGLGSAFVNEVCGIRYAFITDKLMRGARGFTPDALVRACEYCAETDYAMKSSSADDTELLKELLIKIAVGETA